MSAAQPAASRATGYVLVLLGAVGFVVGCFLPLVSTGQPLLTSLSLYRLVTLGDLVVAYVGALLYLFVPVACILWVSVSALRSPARGHPVALAGFTIARRRQRDRPALPAGVVLGAWRDFARAHGFESVTFHGLRHGAATLLLAAGVPDTVAMRAMGHADTRILARYQDVVSELQRNAAARMDRLLGGAM